MKYFIGYLIKGKAKKYQENLIEQISDKFKTRNLNEYIPVHFTLKSPFETDNIGPIEDLLEKICETEKTSKIKFGDIGSFNKRVIYLNGEFSPKAIETFRRLIKGLEGISWMKFDKHDREENNFHSTLARAKNSEQFNEIMEFLSHEKKSYEIDFDNITILQRGKQRWNIYREFKLG